MNFKCRLLILAVFLAMNLNAQDVVILKSGEVIQGQIISQDPSQDFLVFKFPEGGEFRILNKDIQNVTSQNYPVMGSAQGYENAPQNPWGQPNYNPYYAQPGYPPAGAYPMMPYGQPGYPQAGAYPMTPYGQPGLQNGSGPMGTYGRGLSSVGGENREKTKKKDGFWDTLRLGVRAGMNSANAKMSDSSKSTAVNGFSVAAVAEIPVYGRLSFQTELGFSQYGYSGTMSGSSVKLNYDAAEAQFLGKLKFFNRTGRWNLALLGGVAPGYRVSAKVSSGTLGLNPNTFSKVFSASGVVGGNLLYRLGKSTELGIDVRQLIGLTNLSLDDVSAKNSTTFVGAILIF
ncbi:MAG: porin family protein [Deltaproteobacteria bacterium]